MGSKLLREEIRQSIQAVANAHPDEHDAIDVYRVFQQEASLMYHTQRVRDQLRSDPFEKFQGNPFLLSLIDRLCKNVQVTEVDHVMTKQGYVLIEATVQIQSSTNNNGSTNSKASSAKRKHVNHMELRFRYERDPISSSSFASDPPSTANYTIDLCRDGHGPCESLLWVNVVVADGTPSPYGAVCIDDDDEEDGWSDMDDDDAERSAVSGDDEKEQPQVEREQPTKRSKTDAVSHNEPAKSVEKEVATNSIKGDVVSGSEFVLAAKNESATKSSQRGMRDRFTAGIDPDLLQVFVQQGLQVSTGGGGKSESSIDEATAFFLLMSFPFYENEFDLVGFVLDAVFGMEDDGEDEVSDDES